MSLVTSRDVLALLFWREAGIELVASLPAAEDAVARCREEGPRPLDLDLPGMDGSMAPRGSQPPYPGRR